jgi:hypothetical protein
MSTPDPAATPPARNSAKKWLVGCLVALVLAVLICLAALLLLAYAAKRQVDAMAPDAKRVYEDARRAAAALESTTPVAADIARTAEARMRLGRAASAVLAFRVGDGEPCPPELARAALPVDADWFSGLVTGIPAPATGTPWMRDPAIVAAAAGANEQQAMIALDRTLGDAGAVAVIHADQPSAAGAAGDGPRFQGYVQLVGYPDGETACTVAFHAEGKSDGELQSNFLAAEKAALGK